MVLHIIRNLFTKKHKHVLLSTIHRLFQNGKFLHMPHQEYRYKFPMVVERYRYDFDKYTINIWFYVERFSLKHYLYPFSVILDRLNYRNQSYPRHGYTLYIEVYCESKLMCRWRSKAMFEENALINNGGEWLHNLPKRFLWENTVNLKGHFELCRRGTRKVLDKLLSSVAFLSAP